MGIPLFDSLPCPSCFDLGSQKSSSLSPPRSCPPCLMSMNFGPPSMDFTLTPSNSGGASMPLQTNPGGDLQPLPLYNVNVSGTNQWTQGSGPAHAHVYPMGLGGLSRWRPGEYSVHNRFLPTNKIAVFEVSVKSETPSSTANTGYAQLLAMTQSLQQQVLMINQQLAGQ